MKKIVLAISGASGSIYASRLLHHLRATTDNVEVGVVLSRNAAEVWKTELGGEGPEALLKGDSRFTLYDRGQFSAPFASGSARYRHMVIAPCSMGTLGRIAHGISDDLITRAADVILKERRQLICLTRETPLSLIHLDNMQTITRAGGIIVPASPGFYSRPASFEALADTVVHRVLDLMGFDMAGFRWGESSH